jgi:hypothetical protein
MMRKEFLETSISESVLYRRLAVIDEPVITAYLSILVQCRILSVDCC